MQGISLKIHAALVAIVCLGGGIATAEEGAPAVSIVVSVAEQKLAELAPDKLKEFTQNGILSRVYSHLISLANFARLLDRRTTAAKAPERKKPN